jgi:hypothetical protein
VSTKTDRDRSHFEDGGGDQDVNTMHWEMKKRHRAVEGIGLQFGIDGSCEGVDGLQSTGGQFVFNVLWVPVVRRLRVCSHLKSRNKDTNSWEKSDLYKVDVEDVKLAIQMQKFIDRVEQTEGK